VGVGALAFSTPVPITGCVHAILMISMASHTAMASAGHHAALVHPSIPVNVMKSVTGTG